MNPQRNGDARFRLTLMSAATTQLAAILRRAQAIGRRTDVIAAARRIDRRLRMDARSFGEPIKSHPDAQIDERRAAIAPLVVYYGVHLEQPEVFIREFRGLL
jgi:hypothetical protein